MKIPKWMPVLFALALAAAGIIILAEGAPAAAGVRRGLELCGMIVIPSLFPFMALSSFLTKSGFSRILGRPLGFITKPLFGLPGSAATAIFLSFVSGYPVGSRMAVELYLSGQISLAKARRMLYFTINAGPAMILSAVGAGMLRSKSAGIILLISHIGASIIIGFLTARFRGGEEIDARVLIKPTVPKPNLLDAFVESVADASGSMLAICSWVILFSGFLGIVPVLPSPWNTAFTALFEVTTGCGAAAGASVGLPVIAAILGWGGLSVHFQVLSSAYRLRPSMLKFFIARAAHAALSFFLCTGILILIKGAVPTLSNGVSTFPAAYSVSIPASSALLAMSAVLLWSVSHKNLDKSMDFSRRI